MVQQGKVLHDFHQRKRVHLKKEVYPNPNKWKRLIDNLIYIIGGFSIIMTFPQILKIWVGKNATGVSALSWGAYVIGSCFWLVYGIVHKEKPIIFVYIIWIMLNSLVLIGTLIYGG